MKSKFKHLIDFFREFRKFNGKKLRIIRSILLLIFALWYTFCLPDKIFIDDTSSVLFDRNGNLLGAKIASDGQWRFPQTQDVPSKFKSCIIEFEDRNFETHIGISLKGICRAFYQNFKENRVVSGGSTITMQVARIMRKNPKRTYFEKSIELLLATRLEIHFSKDEILALYASNAPFGNNVVGLETAAWRYFGRKASQLSWSESATLAVLPNAPGLIYPGKNHDKLLRKRNRLLKRLFEQHVFDETTYQLAIDEPLPDKPLALPQLAPHTLENFAKKMLVEKQIHSSIDIHIQENVIQQLSNHHNLLSENGIFNGAVIVSSVNTGEILAYVGNTNLKEKEFASDVDCAIARRSTGSILKPFLYAKSLEDGIITPEMLLNDIPSQFGSFSPKNFTGNFNGALPASKALSRSLNVPMVHLLNQYGLSKFHSELQAYGLTSLEKPAKHYGLSLILGGAEAKLIDLTKAYTQMAQELKFGYKKPLVLEINKVLKDNPELKKNRTQTDRACIFSCFEAMTEVNRPDEDDNWRYFSSEQKIAWKTGTSFGFRDAWVIGITPDYVVAVWIGNADGEGRPGLTGIKAAAPLMFDVFRFLPKSKSWFSMPKELMSFAKMCKESGHRATNLCQPVERKWIPKTALNSKPCPYHQMIHLNKKTNQRVDSDCEEVANMKHESWFVLPSIVEKFYKNSHPNYKTLPDYKKECWENIADKSLGIIYPKNKAKIYIPIEIDGKLGETIFEATHKNPETKIFWHLDEKYLGSTQEIHHLALKPKVGKHTLNLIDENGVSISVEFEVLGKSRKK
ncbi:MAG: penicillin-binding protein 1C [Bacteroidota bacterium]